MLNINFVPEDYIRSNESRRTNLMYLVLFVVVMAGLGGSFTTAELLEPVPRSVLLASLTNNLPAGVSLLRLNLIQKEPKVTHRAAVTNSYQAAQAETATADQPKIPQEKLLDTYIDIEGIAPSDLQVAAYIEQLNGSILLENVALVESKEYEIEDTTFRRFKLSTTLRKDIHLTKEDIKNIRARNQESAPDF